MAALPKYLYTSEVAVELAPKCVVCANRTTMACSSCGESICWTCADENNWFDSDDIICEGCTDAFMARVYRDSNLEAKGA
jgi:hypothetical protein